MAAKKTAIGQTITDKRTDGPESDDLVHAQARGLWEGSPKATAKSVGAEVGVPRSTILSWMKNQGWKKIKSGKVSTQAKAAADNYKQELSKLGPEVTTEQMADASAKASEVTAVEMRAAVLDRHRSEWSAPRALSYEAIKARDFEKAKLAKITAETLMLIQSGERKAWGMDAKDPNPDEESKTIVIERE